jgi:hypothetical protein
LIVVHAEPVGLHEGAGGQRGAGGADVAAADELDGHLLAGFEGGQDARDIGGGGDGLAVEFGEDVAGLQAPLLGAEPLGDGADEDAFGFGESGALGSLEGERAHLHAQGRAAEEGFAPFDLGEGEGRQGQGGKEDEASRAGHTA